MQQRHPVLIIGAGISGLVLAQALRKLSIPFLVFERDAFANSRLQGWALTIHFALGPLLELLPDDVGRRLDATQVDPQAAHDRSDSVFVNLETCEYKWKLPPGYGDRKRLSRDRFRQLLLSSLHDGDGDGDGNSILWGKQFADFAIDDDGLPVARFADGSAYRGALLVGADGASSKTRARLYDLAAAPAERLPITFLGTSLVVREVQLAALRRVDPTLFQGCHPGTATWMWFSVMESPRVNGTARLPPEARTWKIQLCLSWPKTTAAAGGDGGEDLSTDAKRIEAMRERAAVFDPRLGEIFFDGLDADHSPVLKLDLFDWATPGTPVRDTGGAVTLVGDAAHTMAMYKGEGFNHSILDVYHLAQLLKRMYSLPGSDEQAGDIRREGVKSYESEVQMRGQAAVAMCRKACLEVHNWDRLSDKSAVRRKVDVPLPME